jgi:hypothetical protein
MDACDSPEGDHFTRTRTGTAGTHEIASSRPERHDFLMYRFAMLRAIVCGSAPCKLVSTITVTSQTQQPAVR